MKLAIYGSRQQAPYAQQIAQFLDLLASRGVEVVMHRKLYDLLQQLMPEHLSAVCEVVNTPDFDADVVLSIGGDGTFLRTAMWVGSKEIPILGINTGHLGFLSGANIDELPEVAAELIEGRYDTSDRALIHATGVDLPGWPYALNEAALTKEETASMIVAETKLDGYHLADYRADGLIVATPTGSTAYNLSVGGPILQPDVPAWVLSPIAAHSLGMRPLVVNDDSRLDVTVTGRARSWRLTLDGRGYSMPIGATVRLSRAPFFLKIVTRPDHDFPTTLRKKLRWNE